MKKIKNKSKYFKFSILQRKQYSHIFVSELEDAVKKKT
jgi:hypothetical protein